MPVLIFLLIVLFAAAVAGIVATERAKRRRVAALAATAHRLGLQFSLTDLSGVQKRYGYFTPLKVGHKRYAFNVLEGIYRERPVCCFEYHYETYSSNSKGRRQTHHHYLTAAAIHLPHGLGYLMVRPENIFDKLAGAVGFNDIDFESVEFSRRFYVKSLDRKFAYDIIHARTMEFLLHRVASGFAFELAGPALLLYNGARWRPEQVPNALDWLVEFVELIPDYVWHDAKEQGR